MISKNLKKRIYTSLILLILFFIIFRFNSILVFSLIILSVLSLLEFLNMSNKIIKNKLYFIISNTLFSLYIFLFSFIFFYFSNFLQLKILIFCILFGCIASDIGGFIFGKLFKGPKLTKISPNKTFSGAIGSFIFTGIAMSGSIFYFTNNYSYKIILIAVITSLSCQIGDLFFSFLKRKAKLKDTGNFLPGHGGVLDRLDGIFIGLPIGVISLTLLY